jgi:hypothetical protein
LARTDERETILECGTGDLEIRPYSVKGSSPMRWFRLSIAWLMFAVTIIAVDCAALRKPGGFDDTSQIKKTGLVLTLNILAIGLFRILSRRDASHAQLKRFEISGLVVVILFALAPYLGFLEPLVGAIDRVVGAVSNRLVVLLWHPLSDFEYGDPFGRLVTYVVLIMLPAILLTALLSGLALAVALLWHVEPEP